MTQQTQTEDELTDVSPTDGYQPEYTVEVGKTIVTEQASEVTRRLWKAQVVWTAGSTPNEEYEYLAENVPEAILGVIESVQR
jgi:hypothetical protein